MAAAQESTRPAAAELGLSCDSNGPIVLMLLCWAHLFQSVVGVALFILMESVAFLLLLQMEALGWGRASGTGRDLLNQGSWI